MEVSYQRDLNHNYMIVENGQMAGGEYTVRMLEQNDVAELLKFKVRKMNGNMYLYYDITSRQSISQIYENCCMKHRDIEQLLLGIQNVLIRVHQYLLNSEDLLLKPEFIYMDVDTKQIRVCYVPHLEELGESGKQSFHTLAEFILKRLDHGERRAVDLGYELFALASRENFSLRESLRMLLREEERENFAKTSLENQDIPGEVNGGAGNIFPEREEKGSGRNQSWEADGERGTENSRKNRTGSSQSRESRKNRSDRTNRINRNKGSTDKSRGITILLCGGAVLLIMLIFAAVVYFGKLDLTQTGGLAFLMLAVVWIAYSILSAGKEKKKKRWAEEDMDDDEDAFIEALLSETYDQSDRYSGGSSRKDLKDSRYSGGSREDLKDSRYNGSSKTDLKDSRYSGGSREDLKDSRYNRYSEEEGVSGEMCGETRCLTQADCGKQIRLVSQEPEKYPDIEIEGDTAVIGKKKDQVDIWIGWEAVSRMHARVEKERNSCFMTDLNSMNGTFVNADRLRPNERRPLSNGDRISFANLHYRVKIRDFS